MAQARRVEIYIRPFCEYCARALAVLERKNHPYQAYNIWESAEKRLEMKKRSGGRSTVPQIFIDESYLGESTELLALEEQGVLDSILSGESPLPLNLKNAQSRPYQRHKPS